MRHVDRVAELMRECDIEELRAATGDSPLQALLKSCQMSSHKWAIMGVGGDEAIGLFGVARVNPLTDKGAPWLLATPELEKEFIPFLRNSRKYVQTMLSEHSFLENWVDARNLTSIKWLRFCGFQLRDPVLYGREMRPFHRFTMRR